MGQKNTSSSPLPTIRYGLVLACIVTYILAVATWSVLFDNSNNDDNDVSRHHHRASSYQKQQAENQIDRVAAVAELARAAWQNRPNINHNGQQQQQTTAHDAIDTLLIIPGLEREADEALRSILDDAAPLPSGYLVSEAVQRFVGGMLGAFSLTNDQRFLDRALYHASTARRSAFLLDLGEDETKGKGQKNNNNNKKKEGVVVSVAATGAIIPRRFIQTPGFERMESSGSRQEQQQQQQQDFDSMKNNAGVTNSFDGRCPVSEIVALALPFEFLSTVTTDKTYAEQGTAFQRWVVESGIAAAGLEKKHFDSRFDVVGKVVDDASPPPPALVVARRRRGVGPNDGGKQKQKMESEDDEATLQRQRRDQFLLRPGLLPCFVHCTRGTFSGSISVGPFGKFQLDSYLKRWILGGKRDGDLVAQYEDAVDALVDTLARYTTTTTTSTTTGRRGTKQQDKNKNKKQHFATLGSLSVDFDMSMPTADVCAIPGVLALGLMHGVHSQKNRRGGGGGGGGSPHRQHKNDLSKKGWWDATHVEAFASDLLTTCVSLMLNTTTHLMPTNARFLHIRNNKKTTTSSSSSSSSSSPSGGFGYSSPEDRRASLKPALAESLFYFYRYTRDEGLRDIAWELAKSLQKFSPTGVPWPDVMMTMNKKTQQDPVGRSNNDNDNNQEETATTMDPDYLSQTLKFLYLTFSDVDLVPLDRFVFDHGGHPLRIP